LNGLNFKISVLMYLLISTLKEDFVSNFCKELIV